MKVDKCDATDLRDIADHLELHGHYAFVPAMLRKAADRLDRMETLLRRVLNESSISYDVSGCEDLIPSIEAELGSESG